MSVFVNISGVWKEATSISVNVGGIWKPLTSLSVNTGTWKTVDLGVVSPSNNVLSEDGTFALSENGTYITLEV